MSRTILRHKSNSLTRSHIRGSRIQTHTHVRAFTHTRAKFAQNYKKRRQINWPRVKPVLPPTPPTRVLSLSSFSSSAKKARKERKGLTSRNSIPVSRSLREIIRSRVHFFTMISSGRPEKRGEDDIFFPAGQGVTGVTRVGKTEDSWRYANLRSFDYSRRSGSIQARERGPVSDRGKRVGARSVGSLDRAKLDRGWIELTACCPRGGIGAA